MARKRLLMNKIREVLRLKWAVRLPTRAVARSCGVGIGTVSGYVREAQKAGLSWPLPPDLDDQALDRLLHPGVPPQKAARPVPVWAEVHQELQRPGVTLQLVWLEYLAALPEGYRYSQFCELYRRWARRLNPTMRQHHRAGDVTFVDFSGHKPTIVDPRTGEVREVELFVAVLGASSYVYAEACESQTLADWIGAHVRMAEFFGGSTRIWTPDNLKSGIDRPDRYEAGVNRTYEDLARHYGAAVIPARVGKARDKAMCEAAVLLAQRWILARLRNRTFFSLEELNLAIRQLLAELNERIMKVFGVSRTARFETLDRPALLPLPTTRYELAHWKRATVNIDYHVEVQRNYYSVPYTLVSETVDVRFTQTTVEVLHRGQRIASHTRLTGRGRCSTLSEHMPSSHRAHAAWTPSRILRWAGQSGRSVEALVARILEERPHPEQGYRAALGLIRLGERYGTERLDDAAARALALHSPRYQTVKHILATGTDRVPLAEEPASTIPSHDNIRGADFYAAEETPC
jgi:transposase